MFYYGPGMIGLEICQTTYILENLFKFFKSYYKRENLGGSFELYNTTLPVPPSVFHFNRLFIMQYNVYFLLSLFLLFPTLLCLTFLITSPTSRYNYDECVLWLSSLSKQQL